MEYVEIKKSLVWSFLRRDANVYYAWVDRKKHLLNEESVRDVCKILGSDTDDYHFFIEEDSVPYSTL